VTTVCRTAIGPVVDSSNPRQADRVITASLGAFALSVNACPECGYGLQLPEQLQPTSFTFVSCRIALQQSQH
jgi:hypothetical protein